MVERQHIFSTLIRNFSIFFGLAKARLMLLPLFMLFSSLFDSIGIVMFFPLLGKLNLGGNKINNEFVEFFSKVLGFLHINSLGSILAFIFIVFLVKFIILFFQDMVTQRIMIQLYRKISADIINGWENADYEKLYLDTTTGYFTNILTTSIWTFLSAFRYYCYILTNIFCVSVYICASVVLEKKITLVAFVTGVSIFSFFRFFTVFSARYSVKFTAEQILYQNRLIEFMQFFKYFKSTFRFKDITKNLHSNIKKMSSIQFRTSMIGNFLMSVVEPLSVLSVVILLYLQIVVWKRDFGTIAVLMLLFYRIITSIIGLQGSWQKYYGCSGAINVILEALDKVRRFREKNGKIKKEVFSSEIVFKDVCFAYANKEVLSGLNLVFPKNKTIALAGPSGAGKSTIVDLITGVLKPTSGRILIDGLDYKDLDIASLREKVGYVMQENVMFHDTIFNNISLWEDKPDADKQEKVVDSCGRAYCWNFIEKMPQNYQTTVGDRGIKLSVGQRQRLAIARELYRDTQILILDEATSSLDTESEIYIKRSIENLKGNKTLIIIAHRLSTIKHADYIYLIDGGRVMEEGSLKDLFENKDTKFYKMCQLQSF